MTLTNDKENDDPDMDLGEESSNDEEISESDEDVDEENTGSRVYLPNADNSENVDLECDESAYVCHHAIKTGSPCLSFDILPDELGDNRADEYPLTMTVVGGTQVDSLHCNHLLIMKLSNMHKNKHKKERNEDEDEEEESDSESDSEEDTKPVLECASVRHTGCVNRIQVTTLGSEPFAASWSELDKVYIWNLTQPVRAVNDKRVMTAYIQNKESPAPVFTFNGHTTEGFGLQWSPTVPGVLASGDCKGNIHLWKPLEGGTWHVDQRPYNAHTDSVEDIKWSPNESNVMVSCSVDKTIRVWDVRAAPNKACMLTKQDAHDSDVNVISWNPSDPFILSGGDDGKLRVWDLRRFPDGDAICTFKHHTAPITSVEWHPTDHSVFAASSSDDQLTQWDLAIERDEDAERGEEMSAELLQLPPQLLFIHQGQKEIKELHWHRQMPGVLVSTAQTGLNVIRTLSV
ncbi:glutamate-rich WD repeat-containing protein 1 [Parasteatoda tepidariorum]|uniref:glutamate-rich WD repeat-containing protein 1 n=1 Tax=Parasteatoda tepidariorum TaxID=114398 RepID=UPI00077F85F3|nr:glutamate-rich WD repeat-containing protein 1 [Parasteatoda tepidariorum]